MKQRTLTRKLEAAHLSPQMRNFTFERFDLRYYSAFVYDEERSRSYLETARLALHTARNFVRSFLNNEAPEGILFTGPVGSGKTFLACCIVNAIVTSPGQQVLFVVVPDFLDQIRATYDDNNDYTEQQLLDSAKTIPLLVLDDLGAHHYSEWALQKIYSILNYRLNYSLPTIITTNISLDEMQEHLGERTASRIVQLCRPVRLLVDVDIRIARRMQNGTMGR
ncbi:MAG: ATP-binding protein [Peptococcaceae bacterium]|nr:ATP-binding protein [Peptococcaceae bacterium]